ncbi:MAG: recombinase family protein, partial [Desulfovibrio sp.]|nr:recombinase family protein [Desulfovibrio sp.]
MNTQQEPKRIRCAIYTRKSTEEGLEQEFNSLDAQREAAEAYIVSQRSEGWECLPSRYDDGGFTGGNVDRPALQRLLADVDANRVDCVVVYKVDRLSRSLLDFSKLMDSFDKHGVSFVSVTQQFNTTHSMGRLTLNILLSFAQFEREIIAERTKDKMSAARRKGKWVGGIPMLGYNIAPDGGKLLVNPEEAVQTRALFTLYLERESLLEVCGECDLRGWRTKEWKSAKGRVHGGKPYTKNDLQRLLRNVIYLGKVEYEGRIYEGEHEAIVDEDTWERVQKLMTRNWRTGGKEVRNRYGALLRNLLRCAPCGSGMTHTISTKNGKSYRYYVCSNAQKRGRKACPTPPLNAHEIEQAVVDH